MTSQVILGDCLTADVGRFDAIVTDPPYPDYLTETYRQTPLDFLRGFDCRQLVFWSARAEFPLDYTARHVWDKLTGCACPYEFVYERNGQRNYLMFRHYLVTNHIGLAPLDRYVNHPSQKPVKLMRALIELVTKPGDTVYDPFCGSGTTGVACIESGRNFVGVEIEPGFAAIARKRIDAAMRQTRLFQPAQEAVACG